MVPDAQQPDKPKDHELGSYCFEELEPAKVIEVVSTEVIEPQAVASKGVECSLKSRKSPEVEGIVLNYEQELGEKHESHICDSESSKSPKTRRYHLK